MGERCDSEFHCVCIDEYDETLRNDAFQNATNLGSLGSQFFKRLEATLDSSGDNDWYLFSVAQDNDSVITASIIDLPTAYQVAIVYICGDGEKADINCKTGREAEVEGVLACVSRNLPAVALEHRCEGDVKLGTTYVRVRTQNWKSPCDPYVLKNR